MKIILDTNILCSALICPGGFPDQLYRAWREKRFVLITSEEQLEELRRVTRYPRVRRFIEPAAAGTMHNELRHLAVLLTDLPTVDRSPDPADNFLLAMAQAGDADFLVTGDKHDLLDIGTFQKTAIVTARQMTGQLGRKRKVGGARSPGKTQKRRGRTRVQRTS
jgi:putative PIN family toxin of toxin-antitoxin system